MDEVKRYGMTWHLDDDDFVYVSPKELPNGQWVRWDDYARLKTEVELVRKYWKATGEGVNRYVGKSIALEDEVSRLKAEVDGLVTELKEARMKENVWYVPIEEIKHSQMMRKMLQSDVNKLKAEVERMTKAGDAVCESPYLWETDPAVIAWRAAKEGKQSNG
jgi:hypothetical protein